MVKNFDDIELTKEQVDISKKEINFEYHVATAIPGFGPFFNFGKYVLNLVYQNTKRIEDNLAKFMEEFGLNYSYFKEYAPASDVISIFRINEKANEEALNFYQDNIDKFKTVDDLVNSLNIDELINEKGEYYTKSFVEALWYYDEHGDYRKGVGAEKERKNEEKEKRERESVLRDRQIELMEKWFDPDDEGAKEIMSSESAIADMLMLNTKFFEGFLKALQDIQADKERFNDRSLKDVEDDAEVQTEGMGIEYSEGYKYAVRRNKLSPEELKEYYPNKWVEEANVDLSIVEKNLKSLEDEMIVSSELEAPTEEKKTRDDITVMKEDIAEMKGNINTITDSLKKISALFEVPQPKETGEKYERLDDSAVDKIIDDYEKKYPIIPLPSMRSEEDIATTPPTESVNLVVEEVRLGFESILNAFAESQTSADPTAGEDKILTVSLTDENANNISTLIVEKLNEEEAAVPAINAVEGVTNEELGIEVRDSLRAIKEDIAENKNILIKIIRAVREKAMTFDQIYFGVFDRLAREYESETGRRVR